MSRKHEASAFQLKLVEVPRGGRGVEIGHPKLSPAVEFQPEWKIVGAGILDLLTADHESVIVADPEVAIEEFERVVFGWLLIGGRGLLA